jgi:hypothetical protein
MNDYDRRHFRFSRKMDDQMKQLPWSEQVRIGDRLADAFIGLAIASLLIWIFA